MVVLIVDDEPSIRSLVKRLLGSKYIVLEAADGEAAVEIARRDAPDIILMDILMPKMSGYAALRAIKTNPVTKGITVVMLTGLGSEIDKKLASEMGADGYITKPFSLRDLEKTIGRLLKSRR
jgi:two-component system alkaline phosphatase synthesis response regulator PhoP